MSVQRNRSDALEESEIFHILGNDRRREIVQLLARRSERVDVSDVATAIADLESDSSAVPNNLYKSVYVSLQQTHLPQLEEDGVIEYDTDEKTIEPGPTFEEVRQYVADGDDDRRQIIQIHLLISVLGLVFVALAGTDLPVFSDADAVLWSLLALLAVATSSLYDLLS